MDNIAELLQEAASLMAIGMAMVFLFLTLLIFVVRLMSRLAPQEQPPQFNTKPEPNTQSVSADQVDPRVIAVISAAIHKHRSAATQ